MCFYGLQQVCTSRVHDKGVGLKGNEKRRLTTGNELSKYWLHRHPVTGETIKMSYQLIPVAGCSLGSVNLEQFSRNCMLAVMLKKKHFGYSYSQMVNRTSVACSIFIYAELLTLKATVAIQHGASLSLAVYDQHLVRLLCEPLLLNLHTSWNLINTEQDIGHSALRIPGFL